MHDVKGGNDAVATTPVRADAETARTEIDPSKLDGLQLDGSACVICKNETNPMQPVGTHLGVQMFMCVSHDNPPAEDLTADQLSGTACVTCGATGQPMHVAGQTENGDVYECDAHVEDEPAAPFWSPQGCPAWCTDNHGDMDEESDRVHSSIWKRVTATTMDMEDFGAGSGTRNWVAHTSEVALWQGYREVEPRVLYHDAANDRYHQYLTLDEAEQVALHILSLVRQARGKTPDEGEVLARSVLTQDDKARQGSS